MSFSNRLATMFLLSMVPFNDRFNLILIQKIGFFLLTLAFFAHSSYAQLNNRIPSHNYLLKIDDFDDFSFDNLQLCENVTINLEKLDKLNGILRSPEYRIFKSNDEMLQLNENSNLPIFTKCKWTILAPSNHKIQIKIIDFEQKLQAKCPNDVLEIKTLDESKNLWIDVIDNDQKEEKYFENFSISTCDLDFKSFTTINSNSNKIQLNYETINSKLNVFLSFSIIKNTDESTQCTGITCQTQLDSNLNHLSCIKKNLLCNCPSFKNISIDFFDNCDYLVQNYDNNFNVLNQFKDKNCNYYSRLNTECRQNSPQIKKSETEGRISLIEQDSNPKIADPIVQPEPDLDDICYNVIRTKEFGWIASPNFYSQKYDNIELNCTYRIIIQPYQTIQLRFKYFYLKSNSFENSDKVSYEYLNIFDGSNNKASLLAKMTSFNNDFKTNFYAKVFNSKSNVLYIQYHAAQVARSSYRQQPLIGFNFTYQIKGYCIENQKQCNSIYELNCFSPEQQCNDAWDCNNGADERGCFGCVPDKFRCKNNIFCYRLEDRCDGDHQCVDKSDELNCDKWTCNSANGTFLCNNGRCIYEQWVCDGANDCEDNSDEINCPTGLTSRRVITTAVLGGTLCCLLLVMALGCACKLYTLHTATYRGSFRLPQSGTYQLPAASLSSSRNRRRSNRQRHREGYNLSSFIRRLRTETSQPARSETTNSLLSTVENSANENTQSPNNELPLPHHLIAPPTYNQTMGLVDEYEQRQLAFIEHVRSILSQQQQNGTNIINLGNGTQMSSMSIIPGSSSTTLYRVSNMGRRSHRHRHHRSSDDQNRHRRHRRHHNNTTNVNNSQISFDMNRRGLHETNESEQNQLVTIPECSRVADTNVAPSTSYNKNSNVNSNSANLRDRIAKLIKDIVVHHGDNIQYVQLGDNNVTTPNSSESIVEQTVGASGVGGGSGQTSSSQTNSSSNSSEDDVPLIQP